MMRDTTVQSWAARPPTRWLVSATVAFNDVQASINEWENGRNLPRQDGRVRNRALPRSAPEEVTMSASCSRCRKKKAHAGVEVTKEIKQAAGTPELPRITVSSVCIDALGSVESRD